MWRATISSLWAHKLRLALTALAIVLGVAFVAGTLIYTDTTRSTFDSVFTQAVGSVDLNVRGVSQLDDAAGVTQFEPQTPAVPPDVADRVAAVEGVAAVQRNVDGFATLLDDAGNPIGGQGPPTLGLNAPTVEELTPTQLRDGRYPTAPTEVAIDAATARTNGVAIGDTIRIAANGPVDEYEVVGTFGFGEDLDNLAGATVTLFDPDTAFELFNQDGGYTSVDVLLADGARPDAVQDRITGALGDEYEVVTNDQLAAETQESIDTILGFLNTGLLVFAGVSLLVGAFIINNTFAIIVAQRSRELALLRAVGASRRQVLGSVLLEALVVGVVASVVGVAVGVGVAGALQQLLATFGVELPDAALVIAPRTVAVGVGLGVVVTLVSALLPALTAVRVPPVAAMQQVAVVSPRFSGRLRTISGLVVATGGLVALAIGLFNGGGFAVVVGGAAALMIGVALLARYVTRPLLRGLGWPITRLGTRGALAQDNAVRNPQRTAATASALMIGVGLVTFALIFGASVRESTTRTIDEQFASDLQIQSQNFSTFPVEVEQRIGALPEITGTADLRVAQVAIRGQVGTAGAVEPSELGTALSLEPTDGSLSAFDSGGMLITDDAAERLDLRAGDTLTVTFAEGARDVPVRAVVDGSGLDFDYLFDEETLLDNAADDGIFTLYLRIADGVSVDDARAAVEGVTDDFAALTVQDSEELKDQIATQVNQTLGLMSALLALSILIALFGIANTLSLSVFERVRELGLLRAVGATRSQVRSIVRWEAVLIALLGAVFGVGIGTVFGWMTIRALADQGLSTFAFPAGQVVVAILIAAVAGIVAAWLPARRAARVDVLRALAAE